MAETYRIEDPETGLSFYRSTVESTDDDRAIAIKLASDAMLNAMVCRIRASRLTTYERLGITNGPNVGPELKHARAKAQSFFSRAHVIEFVDFLEGKAEYELDAAAEYQLRKAELKK